MFKQYPKYKFVLALCDYLILLGAWAAAIYIRFYDVPLMELLSRPLVRTQAALIVVYSLVWIIIFQHFNLYKLNLFMAFGEQMIAIIKSLIYGLIGLVLITAGVIMCLLFAYADQPMEEDPLVHGRRRR